MRCNVLNCNNYYGKQGMSINIKFHRFSKNKDTLNEWIEKCETKNIKINSARVCSIHFNENCFRGNRLKDDAIPTLFLPISYPEETAKENSLTTEKCIQTEGYLEYTTILELEKTKLQLQEVELELDKYHQLTTNLKNFMTNGQIKKLECGNKRRRWNNEDISLAMQHYVAGPRLYKFLRNKTYPLPESSVLRKWAIKRKLQRIESTRKVPVSTDVHSTLSAV